MQKLKRLREDRVLSQRELARMADLAFGTVWRIENGYPEARTSTIRKLAGSSPEVSVISSKLNPLSTAP